MQAQDLLPHVMVDVPGCPLPIAQMALMRAAITLCSETDAWQEVQDPIQLIDGETSYQVDAPSGAELRRVLSVWTPSGELKAIPSGQVSDILPNWQSATGSEPMFYVGVQGSPEIHIYPRPYNMAAGGVAITVKASYKPKLSSTTLPDSLVSENFEALLAGTKANLMITPGRAWSNPQLAGFYKTEFENAIVDVRIKAMHDGVQGSITARPRRFGF